MKPRFSVVIPSFNRAATLERSIESVLVQTYSPHQIILVDDGSTDSTQKIVSKFPKVTYHYQKNKGVSAARNKGVELATGEWLIFLDSDDELLPNALYDFQKEIEIYRDVLVFSAGYILIQGIRKNEFIPKEGRYIGQVSGSFVINRKLFLKLGGYDTRLKFGENTELFFRIEWQGYQVKKIFKSVLYYFQNPNGGNNNLTNVTESLTIILEKHNHLLSNRIKRIYHQILGVNFMRFRKFSEARKHLLIAYKLNFKRLDTFGRLFISCLPFIALKLYPESPKN
ncbi:glycosyltransferase family A protein [Algoriphagus sp.]|uniref:glycosyltransferase family 2 protein n=1 Tax=Algoriphagus sp. TaxID=1872435 RepID=UPI00261837A3|nr:glycosyltransferase family A protein [Algoriphagus sp.]